MDTDTGVTKKEALINSEIVQYDLCRGVGVNVPQDVKVKYKSLGIGTVYKIDNIQQNGKIKYEFFRDINP